LWYKRTCGGLCPRYWGTTKLALRPGRGAKKLFSEIEALTRSHSRRADKEAILKQRVAGNVLLEEGFYKEKFPTGGRVLAEKGGALRNVFSNGGR